jgi:hypothetical protein
MAWAQIGHTVVGVVNPLHVFEQFGRGVSCYDANPRRHGATRWLLFPGGFPAPNRPETHVAIAECRDVRLGGSGGTNPARRFWTRLPMALRPSSNSGAIVSPFILQGPTKHSKSGFDPVFSNNGRWSPKPKQAAPWLSKWNSCSGSRMSWFRRSGRRNARTLVVPIIIGGLGGD